jgi:hypothetical protein
MGQVDENFTFALSSLVEFGVKCGISRRDMQTIALDGTYRT